MTHARINVDDYYDKETFQRIKNFADTKETPFVVIDTATVSKHYDALVQNFKYAKIY